MSPKSSPLLRVSGAVLLLLTVMLYAALSTQITPRISGGQFRVANGEWQPYTDTLPAADNPQTIDLTFMLSLSALHASRYQIIADDCVEKLSINGIDAGTGMLPFCDLERGRVLNLAPQLHPGTNAVAMTIQNVGGPASFTWRIAWSDPLLLALRAFLFLGLIAGAILLAKGMALNRWQSILFGTVSIGAFLRLLYVLATPYQTRAYDADGHLEYIRYVAQHLWLPPIRDGWEYYQAPLYYVLTALWHRIGLAFDRALPLLIRDTQWIAFVASLFALGAAAWIAVQAFSRKERVERLLFVGSFAVLPSIVFLSARINNDVFLFPLEVLCFAFLLAWWRGGQWRHWWAALLLLALSILTKTNGLLLVPVAFLLLLLKSRLALRTKAVVGSLSLLLLFLSTAWLFTLRSGASIDQPLVVNTGNLSSALYVKNTVETFTEFNPLRMAMRPYNNPWDDVAGRQYFWEYFFKSAFFGEFDLGPTLKPLASAIIVCGVLALLYAVYGAWISVRREGWRTLPFTLAAFFLLLGHALHRYMSAFSCSQDFRYSLLVSVPVFFFLVEGLKNVRSPFLKSFGTVVALSGIALQAALLVSLLFTS